MLKLARVVILLVILATIVQPEPLPRLLSALKLSERLERIVVSVVALPRLPIMGVGGAGVFDAAMLDHITSFREWDHYHAPGGTLPVHRFWTWGKMNRPVGTPAGDCLSGAGTTRAWMDAVFACDQPVLDTILASYPGAWHGIGNEPNWYPALAPSDYAYQLHLYASYILSADPTAQIMLGGLLASAACTPDWADWLDAVQVSYAAQFGGPFPATLWDIHPYDAGWPDGVAAGNLTIADVQDFRQYLDTRALPGNIVIGEFSDAGGVNTTSALMDYIETTCDWLTSNGMDNGVIAWYWWGVTTAGMGTTGLFSNSPYKQSTITDVGNAYLSHCTRHLTFLPLVAVG